MKSGFVTVIGIPNAGKSSLVNALVGEEVSVVTSKPQTTRRRTLGILNEDNKYQVVFVDTPGFIENANGDLNTFLMKELNESLKDVHVVVAAVASWEFSKPGIPWIVEAGNKLRVPVIYVATQTDIREPDMKKWHEWTNQPLLWTSAHTKFNLDELKKEILSRLPEGPAYYETDIYTNQTLREISSEIVRKNCFDNLHQEVPYGLAINIRDFKEEKLFKIHADIVLNRESHKAMVIGQGGQMIKKIGTLSRQEMEKQFGCQVFLKLNVVVKPQWTKNKMLMEELGYE